jgi:hypothetical protein
MFSSNFNPIQPLPLTLVTSGLIIQGVVRARIRRLGELMNDAESEHLVLEDARFVEIGSHRILGNAGTAQVARSDVLMVHTTTETEGSGELRTSKQPIRATLLAPPFTIEGMIHLAYESEIHVSLHSLTEPWVAVTGARYWAYGVAEEPVTTDLLVVNHARAHVVIARGVEWRPASESAAPRHTPNPW